MKHVKVAGSTASSVECVWLLPFQNRGIDEDGRVMTMHDTTRVIRTAGAQFFETPARLVRMSELVAAEGGSESEDESEEEAACVDLVAPACSCTTDMCTLHVPASTHCLLNAISRLVNGDRSGPHVQPALTALLAAAHANNTPPPRPDALAIMFGLELPPLPLPPDVLADGARILLRVLAVLPRQRFPWQ